MTLYTPAEALRSSSPFSSQSRGRRETAWRSTRRQRYQLQPTTQSAQWREEVSLSISVRHLRDPEHPDERGHLLRTPVVTSATSGHVHRASVPRGFIHHIAQRFAGRETAGVCAPDPETT